MPTASRAARPGGRRSSPARACSAPGSARSACPASPVGLQAEDPTIAELLKNHGYATGQFGKNHLGDLNEFLPTVHGFDEFFGNLYHLNAEEDPEDPDYPSDNGFPEFKERFGPRGVLHCYATDEGRPDRAAALGAGRQADDRGHRPADAQADGDVRRRLRRRRRRLHQAPARVEQAVLLLGQHDAHAPAHAHQAEGASARPGAGSRRTTTR